MMQRRMLLFLPAMLAGIALLCYAALREVTVLEWKEREISVMVPSLAGFAEPESGVGDGEAPQPASDEVNPFESSPAKGAQRGNAPEEENPFASKPLPARQPNAPGPPSQTNAPPKGLETRLVTETYFEAIVLPESAVVRDVTVGGLTRLANGELKRTYSGQPPALCPT